MAHNRQVVPPQQYQVMLGARGRMVLPAAVRDRLGLEEGDRLVLLLDERGEMRLVDLRRQVESCLGMFRDLAPKGRTISEELIAERREEARRDETK